MPLLGMAIVATISGVAIGTAFYGGLWWTTQRLTQVKQPALLVLISLLIRMTIVLSTLTLFARTSLFGLVLCLIAFITTRFAYPLRVNSAQRSSLEGSVK